jgi:hypothetical protein
MKPLPILPKGFRLSCPHEDTCDDCKAQEDRHYCLLYSLQIKNMDLYICDDFERKE